MVTTTTTTFHHDARLSDPESSWEPTRRTSVGRSQLRADVFGILQAAGLGGVTDSERQEALRDDPHGSVSKRRHDLCVDGLVVDSGTARTSTAPT